MTLVSHSPFSLLQGEQVADRPVEGVVAVSATASSAARNLQMHWLA